MLPNSINFADRVINWTTLKAIDTQTIPFDSTSITTFSIPINSVRYLGYSSTQQPWVGQVFRLELDNIRYTYLATDWQVGMRVNITTTTASTNPLAAALNGNLSEIVNIYAPTQLTGGVATSTYIDIVSKNQIPSPERLNSVPQYAQSVAPYGICQLYAKQGTPVKNNKGDLMYNTYTGSQQFLFTLQEENRYSEFCFQIINTDPINILRGAGVTVQISLDLVHWSVIYEPGKFSVLYGGGINDLPPGQSCLIILPFGYHVTNAHYLLTVPDTNGNGASYTVLAK